MRRRLLLMAAASPWLLGPASAQVPAEAFDAVRSSGEIAALLARRDLDAAIGTAARLMSGTSAERLKGAFQIVHGLGDSQYVDLVYARDYGRTGKDIIYKIDFDRAFLFVRYLYQVDHGAWRLIHVHLKTENENPFPREWVHIYPR